MKLIFGGLAIFTVVMVLLAGSGVFWMTSSALKEAKQESVKSLAIGLAYNVSSQMQLFEQTVAQIALDEDVIAAIESGDASVMENTATKVQKFLPVALKIRLLPATVNAVDERQVPVMGYADLEMVKKTLTSKPPSVIQGEGANRHLAVTAAIKKGDQVLGVVLASLKFDFLNEILAKAPVKDNFIEVLQDTVALDSEGNPASKSDNPEQLSIANTPWKISYSYSSTHSFSDIGIIIGLVIVLSALTCLALFGGYFYMAGLMKKDQNTVLEAVKNLMIGKELGSYDLRLSEMQVIISTLVQFKRIIDNKNGKPDAARQRPKDITMDELNDFVDPKEKNSLLETASTFFKKKR